MAEIELRPIARADVRSLSKVLARAFYEDPVMKYMLLDDKARAKALPPMFATLTRNHSSPAAGPRWRAAAGSSAPRRCGIRRASASRPDGKSCG